MSAGSLGPVFRGEDPLNRASVAVKVIEVGLQPPQLHAVVDALSALVETFPSHPSLAAPLAAGLADGAPYVVWPLLDGDALDVALRDYGPALAADAAERLVPLAEALDAAADAVAWHGALHPRDIIVGDRQTFVIGAGVGPVLERVGIRPPMRRPYAAPEVLAGQVSSPASDQYALAAMAYEWLYGARITGPATTRLALPALADVQLEALADAFTSGLAPTPAGRFPDCRAFVEALVLATGGPRPKRARRRRERRERRESLPALPWLADPETPVAVTDPVTLPPAPDAPHRLQTLELPVETPTAGPARTPEADAPSPEVTPRGEREVPPGGEREVDEGPVVLPEPPAAEESLAAEEDTSREEPEPATLDTLNVPIEVAFDVSVVTDTAVHASVEAEGVRVDDDQSLDVSFSVASVAEAESVDAVTINAVTVDAVTTDTHADEAYRTEAVAAEAATAESPLTLASAPIVTDVAADIVVGAVAEAAAATPASEIAALPTLPTDAVTSVEAVEDAAADDAPDSESQLARDMAAETASRPSWWRRAMGRWFGSRRAAVVDAESGRDDSWARGLVDASHDVPRLGDDVTAGETPTAADPVDTPEPESPRRASWWDRAGVVDEPVTPDAEVDRADATPADAAPSVSASEGVAETALADAAEFAAAATAVEATADAVATDAVALVMADGQTDAAPSADPMAESEPTAGPTQEVAPGTAFEAAPQDDVAQDEPVDGTLHGEPATDPELRSATTRDGAFVTEFDLDLALHTSGHASQVESDSAMVAASDMGSVSDGDDDAMHDDVAAAADVSSAPSVDADETDTSAPTLLAETPATRDVVEVVVEASDDERMAPQDGVGAPADLLNDLSLGAAETDDVVATDDVDRSASTGRGFGRLAVAAALVVGIGLGVWAGYAFARRMSWIAVAKTPQPTAPPAPGQGRTFSTAMPTPGPQAVPSRPAPAADPAPSSRPAPPAAPTVPSSSASAPAAASGVPVASPPAAAPRPAAAARPTDAGRRPSPVAPGRLVVRSQPAGAEVTIDGSRRGVTPLVVRDLALGTRRLQLRRTGYAPVEQRITLTARRAARTVSVRLKRAAPATPVARPQEEAAASAASAEARGALVIESRPAGARVTLDGRPSGITPVVISGLAVGDHEVQLERSGFAPVAATARVVAGQRTRLAVSLQQ